MNIKDLNKTFTRINENIELFYKLKFPYANIDVENLFNTIKPEEKGFISDKEIEDIKHFLNIDGTETKEELTGLRNSIVKYYAQESEEFHKKPRTEHTEEEIENYFQMQDQMSAFVAVIDSLMPSKNEVNESLFSTPKVIGKIVQYEEGFNIQDENNTNMLIKCNPSLKNLLLDLANNL